MAETTNPIKPLVTEVTIEYARGLFDVRFLNGSARATLVFNDGTSKEFEWFHDEITYTPRDFLGKTMEEIRKMHYARDLAYLRS